MEKGKENLAGTQQSILGRQRFLDLNDRIGARVHFFGRGRDPRAGRAIVGVGDSDTATGLRLD